MIRRNNKVRRQYTFVHTVCCVIFCVLLFLYLYFYQGDVMALAQHILSGGATSYDKLIGASVITFVMLLVHMFVYSLLRLDRWFYWLTYLPSFLIVAILSDVTPDGNGGVYNMLWLWLAPIIIVLYIIIVRMLGEVDGLGRDNSTSVSLFSKVTWTNLLSITVMMLVTVGVGNTDVMLHNRIKVENEILAGHYEEALNVGTDYEDTDESLTMLRAYALSKKGMLGESLFEFPVKGGSSSLRPDRKKVKSLMIYDGDIVKFIDSRLPGHREPYVDYELCGYLADCRLDAFKQKLSTYYDIDNTLPKHYKEALLMADKVSDGDTVEYADSAMIVKYLDFVSNSSRLSDTGYSDIKFKERFCNTYWYYYISKRRN